MRRTSVAGAVILAFFAASIVSWAPGCGRRTDPNRVYDQVVNTVRHGDLKTSLADVDTALHSDVGHSIEWNWRFRVLKAQILVSRSEYQGALNLLRDELPDSLASSDIGVRKKLMEGIAYRYGQEFSKSQRDLDDALALAQSAQPQLVCEVIKAIGELQVDEKRYTDAENSFHRALELARTERRQDQIAATLANLARVATSEERFGEAIDLNQTALELSRSLDMQGLVATVLGNTAWCYFQLGDFEKALSSFKEAAVASERIGQMGYSFYWLTGVANTYIALDDPGSAEALLTETLKRAQQLQDAETMTICLNALAGISLRANRFDEATNYENDALRIEEAGLDHFGTLQSKLMSGLIETSRRHFAEAERLLKSVLEDPAADTPLRWEAQARLAKLHDNEGLPQRAEHEYRQSIDTIERARSSIDRDDLRLSFLSGGIEFYDDYIEFLVANGRSQDALRVAELSRAQTLAEGLGTSGKSAKVSRTNSELEQYARRLSATFLFYWLGSKHSYLWAITPTTTACFTLPPAVEIDPAVKSYTDAVTQSNDVAESERAVGEKLYAMLVAPAQRFIPPNSRVILLPDGSLYSLNFETLIVPNPEPHFWIEDATLTTASSLSLLAPGARRTPAKKKNLLLIGDALKASDDFDPLPDAEHEMQIVQGYFPKADRTVLNRAQATPSAYLNSNPEQYAYLHFVTHGTASRSWPLESAVILSKEATADAYKLYARDVVTRHLNAELVVISACNGSGIRAYSGEGLVGLSWAFLRAGAHNVIAALWEVSDAPSTAQLMDKLYDGLSRGEDPATALREAKLSLLRSSSSNSVFRKPFYWAPFQLYAGS